MLCFFQEQLILEGVVLHREQVAFIGLALLDDGATVPDFTILAGDLLLRAYPLADFKERRTELKLSMPELGKRIGVNKSTIQRYEADGVDPKRTMIINGLAEGLLTTPEWLTGLSDDKEYSIYTVCQMDLEKHIKGYLEAVANTVNGEPHQQLLTTFLGQIVDLYTILTKYWAVSMKKVDEVAEDEGLKESIGKYAIHIGSITEQVYQKEMEVPIEDMKRYLDGILHLYDEGRTKVSIPELFGIVDQAKQKLIEKGA